MITLVTWIMDFLKFLLAKINTDAGIRTPNKKIEEIIVSSDEQQITIYKDLLTPNKYSRPALKRKGIKAIEIHWVANTNTSAKFTRQYFELRKGGKYGFGSTQYVVDLDGDIVQMIPDDEIAYSSGAHSYNPGIVEKYGNPPYYNTLSIECTHNTPDGGMTPETYKSLVFLCSYLCKKYNLLSDDLILHYDIMGKRCHRWFVEHPNEWIKFKIEVRSFLADGKTFVVTSRDGGYYNENE